VGQGCRPGPALSVWGRMGHPGGMSVVDALSALLLLCVLTAAGVKSEAQAMSGKMSLDHNLPMDGRLPVLTHWRKGRK